MLITHDFIQKIFFLLWFFSPPNKGTWIKGLFLFLKTFFLIIQQLQQVTSDPRLLFGKHLAVFKGMVLSTPRLMHFITQSVMEFM